MVLSLLSQNSQRKVKSMDKNMFELLQTIETLSNKDLKTIITWIDFNLEKRKNNPESDPFFNSSKVPHNISK